MYTLNLFVNSEITSTITETLIPIELYELSKINMRYVGNNLYKAWIYC